MEKLLVPLTLMNELPMMILMNLGEAMNLWMNLGEAMNLWSTPPIMVKHLHILYTFALAFAHTFLKVFKKSWAHRLLAKNNRKKLENDSDILLGFLVTFMAIFINIALEQNYWEGN